MDYKTKKKLYEILWTPASQVFLVLKKFLQAHFHYGTEICTYFEQLYFLCKCYVTNWQLTQDFQVSFISRWATTTAKSQYNHRPTQMDVRKHVVAQETRKTFGRRQTLEEQFIHLYSWCLAWTWEMLPKYTIMINAPNPKSLKAL